MDCDILKLVELLRPNNPNRSDSEDDDEENTSIETTPADIGKKKEAKKQKRSAYDKLTPEQSKLLADANPENEEQLYLLNNEAPPSSDWKKTPQWDISYKQQVTPSDVFLQMNGKSPSTASCEDMILKIKLPEEDHRNIDLKIFQKNIKLLSPKFTLEMPLPHPIDPQRGNAQWNKDTEELIVTLRMDREFDYINF